MARSRTGQILPEGSRVYVEEQLFRADVDERVFRAASAFAFDLGLQPRPALKGIHHPAVAAMNGRSSTLTQALVLRARRNTRQEETQVWHRFVVPHRRVWMWKNGSVEERLFRAALACAFNCGLQRRPALNGQPSSRCRGHGWPLFHAHASSCAPGAKKHPD